MVGDISPLIIPAVQNVTMISIAVSANKFNPNLTMGHMANPQKRCRTCRRAAVTVKKVLKRFKKGTRKW